MKIAVIDNGIYSGFIPVPSKIDKYQVLPDGTVIKRAKKQGELTHGTLCAYIISQINPNIEIVDIKVLEDNKKASIEALITALQWCYKHAIKLIHMSLGTINYHDAHKLEAVINLLLKSGSFLVSAYHNKNLISYPAALPGVFGVRYDRNNMLQDYEYMIDICDGLHIENCFVAHFNRPTKTFKESYITPHSANSYAAPVITGHISKYLQTHRTAAFSEVLSFMQTNAKTGIYESGKIYSYINTIDQPIQSLVISVDANQYSLLWKLHTFFHEKQYHVESFSNINTTHHEEIIPITHYCTDQKVIDKKIIDTLEFIYKPDVILLSADGIPIDRDNIDVFIDIIDGKIALITEEFSRVYNSVEELFDDILTCFI